MKQQKIHSFSRKRYKSFKNGSKILYQSTQSADCFVVPDVPWDENKNTPEYKVPPHFQRSERYCLDEVLFELKCVDNCLINVHAEVR